MCPSVVEMLSCLGLLVGHNRICYTFNLWVKSVFLGDAVLFGPFGWPTIESTTPLTCGLNGNCQESRPSFLEMLFWAFWLATIESTTTLTCGLKGNYQETCPSFMEMLFCFGLLVGHNRIYYKFDLWVKRKLPRNVPIYLGDAVFGPFGWSQSNILHLELVVEMLFWAFWLATIESTTPLT